MNQIILHEVQCLINSLVFHKHFKRCDHFSFQDTTLDYIGPLISFRVFFLQKKKKKGKMTISFFFFFFKKKKNIQTDHHNGMTNCRSTNIWYTLHYMYLIFKVTSMQRNIYTIIRIVETGKHIYKHNC
jgi:hypothetical protein